MKPDSLSEALKQLERDDPEVARAVADYDRMRDAILAGGRECSLCFRPTRNRRPEENGDVLCTECREAKAYTASLTPQQLREEWESIARYAEESEQWG